MLERGSHNDVKIKLRDGEIVANKDILMARSEYFATMFSNDKFIEGETSSVDMSHCSKAVMEKIIKMIFSGIGKYSDLSLDQLLELSHMSEMMLFTKFKTGVDNHVNKSLSRYIQRVKHQNNANVGGGRLFSLTELISGLQLADHYNLTSLKCSITLTLHIDLKSILNDVECSESFKTIPFNLIKDFFQMKIGGLKLPQIDKTKAFMIWLSENEVTEEQKSEIVDSIDFEDFTVDELMTSISDSGLYLAKKINERVLELFKKQEQLLKEKESKK